MGLQVRILHLLHVQTRLHVGTPCFCMAQFSYKWTVEKEMGPTFTHQIKVEILLNTYFDTSLSGVYATSLNYARIRIMQVAKEWRCQLGSEFSSGPKLCKVSHISIVSSCWSIPMLRLLWPVFRCAPICTYVDGCQMDGNDTLRNVLSASLCLHFESDCHAEAQTYLGRAKLVSVPIRILGARYIAQFSQCDYLKSCLDEAPDMYKPTCVLIKTGQTRAPPDPLELGSAHLETS